MPGCGYYLRQRPNKHRGAEALRKSYPDAGMTYDSDLINTQGVACSDYVPGVPTMFRPCSDLSPCATTMFRLFRPFSRFQTLLKTLYARARAYIYILLFIYRGIGKKPEHPEQNFSLPHPVWPIDCSDLSKKAGTAGT